MIGLIGNVIDVSDSVELYINQEIFNAETVQIHGLLKGGELIKLSEKKAVEKFVNNIGNAILIAHHEAFDVCMINESLKRMGLPKLKNKVLDTGILYKKLNDVPDEHFGLDQLCDEFKIPLNDRHTALGDAYITALLFLKIISKMKKERRVSLGDLFINRNKNGLI